MHIGISGIIGAGKTTLAEKLSDMMNLPLFYEPQIGSEKLDEFYEDMKSNSFSFQIFLLNERFKRQQQLIWNSQGGIQDRTIYEDGIFAKMLYEQGMMKKSDYETYTSLFSSMSNFMKKPDLIIHLDVTPENSLERIIKRGRECEKGITLEYLRDLDKHYKDFLNEISLHIRVLKIDWNNFDNDGKEEKMAKMITDACKNGMFIHIESLDSL